MLGRLTKRFWAFQPARSFNSLGASRLASRSVWVRPFAASVAFSGAVAHSVALAAPEVTMNTLKKQNSTTSAAVIVEYNDNKSFSMVSQREMSAILTRDQEDDYQLAKGITIAINKGVIPARVEVEPVCKVDVMGKTADAVAQEVIAQLGAAVDTGCVMTLEGLSGTGKGTTVARLKALLPRAVTWSNGNIFRSLTLLAVTHSEQNGIPLQESLSPENLACLVKMLHFGKYNGKFDVLIDGLGHKALVSEIQNTTLKAPMVGKNIPTVAGVTQGEVINFVKDALQQMSADGISVLLEGRAQTLNYIRTPHRFELVLSDELLIGKRRAAQRMMALAMKDLADECPCTVKDEQVKKALDGALQSMAEELHFK